MTHNFSAKGVEIRLNNYFEFKKSTRFSGKLASIQLGY